jgi:ABC-type sugar transport system substrate-binding protein
MRAGFASLVAGSVLGALLAAPALAAPAAKLSPTDIQATFFNGQPFTASTPSNLKFKMIFTADGKMKRQPIGGGSKGEGTRKLSKDGFCSTWKGSKDNCFTVVSAGDNQWSVLKGSTIMATWSK